MSRLKIALVQMNCPKGKIDSNLTKTADYIDQVSSRNVDIICFPEMNITGYINPTKMPNLILTLENDPVYKFCELTKNNKLTALGGIAERNPSGKPFITQIVAAAGKLQGYYRKVNVAEDEILSFASGTTTPIFKHISLPFGIAICADVGHPKLFSDYAKLGADIVFAASAPGLHGSQDTRNWKSGYEWWRNECQKNLSKFSKENKIYIAVATQAGRTQDEDFPGGGYVFDKRGKLIASTTDWQESVLYSEIYT